MDSPCIVCQIRPFMWVGRFCGYFPIQSVCSNKNNPSKFKKSKFWILITLIVTASIATHLIFSCYEFFEIDGQPSNITNWVLFATEIVHHATSLILLVLNTIQINVRIDAYNELSRYINSPGVDIKRALTEEDETRLKKTSLREVCFVTVLLIFEIVVEYYFHSQHDTSLIAVNFFGAFISSLSEAIILMHALEFSVATNILKYLIKTIELQFDEVLKKSVDRSRVLRQNNATRPLTFRLWIEDNSIQPAPKRKYCDDLGRIRTSYGKITKCLRSLNNSMNPQLLLTIVSTIICLVLTVYSTIRYVGKRNVDMYFCNVLIKAIIEIGAMLYVVFLAEILLKTSELFFENLVTTMASALTYHELTQLESLLEQLGHTPPLFTASGIMELNIGLISSMGATLVTYVLVALQFDTI